MSLRTLHSSLDRSVNWIKPYMNGQLETRFVYKERAGGYPIAYVSSHSGCRMSCKFCFLTKQKQTSFDHVNVDGYLSQMSTVMSHYNQLVASGMTRSAKINVNMMARGEPMANKHVINNWPAIYTGLHNIGATNGMITKVNISTILPHTMRDRELIDVFGDHQPHVYYSMYSTDQEFRKKWIPNALPLDIALPRLRRYEASARISNPVVFHWALIAGENDSIDEACRIAELIRRYKFGGKFNLVRYNPFDDTSAESPNFDKIFQIVSSAFTSSDSYIVPRVGKDAAASCGMFVN